MSSSWLWESPADRRRRQARERMAKMRARRKQQLEEQRRKSKEISSTSEEEDANNDGEQEECQEHENIARNEPVLPHEAQQPQRQVNGQDNDGHGREAGDVSFLQQNVSDSQSNGNREEAQSEQHNLQEASPSEEASGQNFAYVPETIRSESVAQEQVEPGAASASFRDEETVASSGGYDSNSNNPTSVTQPDVEDIVRKMAGICFRHEVSDRAVEDLFSMFCANSHAICELLETGKLRASWRFFIRPKALLSCPKVRSSYVVERAYGGEVTLLSKDDLDTIPNEILTLSHDGPRRLMRTAAYVTLADIKAHHIKVHAGKMTREEIARDLMHVQISADGVRESQKGTRSLIIVSVRIGRCIYLHSVFNPLIGVPGSRPTPTELLRFEYVLCSIIALFVT